jgi:Fe-S-cluster-containing hydrogenase component 2
MRICPTAAVRIRKGRAVKLEDRCIDCGECIKACPRRAIVPLTDQMTDLNKFDLRVALPSPALYGQFDPPVPPGILAAALKRCGFDDVQPLSPACDATMVAIEVFLAEYRGQPPLISSFCPPIVRLVQVKYPELLGQMLPILAPREIAARDAKRRKSSESGIAEDRIGAVYITSCPAKMVAIVEHPGMERSYLDTAVSISDLFPTLASAIETVGERDEEELQETESGVGWAFLGGVPRSLPAENTLTVAGLPNVIRILDDVEKGRLRRYSFIECQACPEGCVGGCLAVENPYVARGMVIKLQQQLKKAPPLNRSEVEQRYRAGEFRMDEPFSSRPLRPLDKDISKAIGKMKERERVMGSLPGIDCGACGAPSCRAFAEDVVLGEAEKEACLFLMHHAISEKVEELAHLVQHHESLSRREP